MRDFAADLADLLMREFGKNVPVEELWPACRALVEVGILVPQDEDLGLVSMGPFRVAATYDAGDLEVLLGILFPAGVNAAVQAGEPSESVVAALSAVAVLFARVFRRSVIFRTSEAEVARWRALVFVHERNKDGVQPTPNDVSTALARSPEEAQALAVALDALIDGIPAAVGRRPVKLMEIIDGRLRSLA